MGKPAVAVSPNENAIPGLAERLKKAEFEVFRMSAGELPSRQLDAIVVTPGVSCTAEMLRVSPRLRLVSSAVIGVDHIDVATATELGILVANCPTEENIVGVAEATIMLALASLLQLKRKEVSLRAGAWRPSMSSHLLQGKTFGLVGYGRIGRAVEARLQGWQAKLQAYDPFVPGTMPLDELLRSSDVVSLHVVLTAQTRNLIGARELALMKPGAVLVNTARGSVVDEAALAAALNEGRLAAAAIDVWEQEPPSMDNPLLACDPERLILTPHCIGHNLETGPSGTRMAFENVQRAMRGELPESVINPEVIPAWRERLLAL